MSYQTKTINELTENEIDIILKLWDISEWKDMKTDYFRSFFKNSEFHFLFESNTICGILRLNLDFELEISEKEYHFFEAVGLVSAEKKKGYGKKLIHYFKENIKKRNLEVIGFCDAELRNFYEKCDIEILYNQAKIIKEKAGTEWVNSEDDDILIFNLSEEKIIVLNQLPENKTYLKEK